MTIIISSLIVILLIYSMNIYAFSPSIIHPDYYYSTRLSTSLYTRTPFISGNWKLNPSTQDEAVELAQDIAKKVNNYHSDVALFVPYVFIDSVKKAVEGSKVMVGAEVCVIDRTNIF